MLIRIPSLRRIEMYYYLAEEDDGNTEPEKASPPGSGPRLSPSIRARPSLMNLCASRMGPGLKQPSSEVEIYQV